MNGIKEECFEGWTLAMYTDTKFIQCLGITSLGDIFFYFPYDWEVRTHLFKSREEAEKFWENCNYGCHDKSELKVTPVYLKLKMEITQ
jgi:hypothetical protein